MESRIKFWMNEWTANESWHKSRSPSLHGMWGKPSSDSQRRELLEASSQQAASSLEAVSRFHSFFLWYKTLLWFDDMVHEQCLIKWSYDRLFIKVRTTKEVTKKFYVHPLPAVIWIWVEGLRGVCWAGNSNGFKKGEHIEILKTSNLLHTLVLSKNVRCT